MKLVIVGLCFLGVVYCQILRPGNGPDEVGVPEYEEIKVESVLTVRSKGSRTGKSSDLSKSSQNATETVEGTNVSRGKRTTEARLEDVNEEISHLAPFHEVFVVPEEYRNRREINPKFLVQNFENPQ